MYYHGIEFYNDQKGRYYFGFNRLIELFSMYPIDIGPQICASDRDKLKRFRRQHFHYLQTKFKDTFRKFNKATGKLGNMIPILQNDPFMNRKSIPMEEAAPYYQAIDDFPFYLDSLLAYFRILGDLVAKVIPYFYDTREKLPTRSFRDHYNWFTKKNRNFDPKYSEIVKANDCWFNTLAGKNPKGMRDLNFHDLAVYQLGWSVYPSGERIFHASQVAPNTLNVGDVLPRIERAVASFFNYCEVSFLHFTHILEEQFDFFHCPRPDQVIFTNFELKNARNRYILLPEITV